MEKWVVVEHAEVGIIVLWHKEFLEIDPSIEQVRYITSFRIFPDALRWIEETLGIPADGPHWHSWWTCTSGPGAPCFAIVRDRRFGSLHGVYTRDLTLAEAVRQMGLGNVHVEEWFSTRTAATRELLRRRGDEQMA